MSWVRANLGNIFCAALVAAVVGAILWGIVDPLGSRARKETAVATATAVSADASKAAAQDTVKILVDTQAAHGRIDVVTSENQRAILSAPGAAEAVGSGVHNTGLRSLCMRDAYHNEPSCQRLLDPGATGSAPADAGSPAAR